MGLRIRNWEKWQSWRSDRASPPWVKVYRRLLTNPEWAQLSDAEKGQLVSMWLVAAERGGELPDSPTAIRKVCLLDDEPDMSVFIMLGFIESDGRQDGVKLASSWRQVDAIEESRGEEKRVEKKREREGCGEPEKVKPAKVTKSGKTEISFTQLDNSRHKPEEWDGWRSFPRTELGWSDDRINDTFRLFADYYTHGKGRGIRTKPEHWLARWRTWCRKDGPESKRAGSGRVFGGPNGHTLTTGQKNATGAVLEAAGWDAVARGGEDESV